MVKEKTCCTCKVVQPLVEFNKQKGRKDGLQSVCRSCNRERSRRYYSENRTYHKQAVRKRSREQLARNRALVYEHLSTTPCVDCGESDPVVLEFDHVRGRKKAAVSTLMCRRVKIERLRDEMRKCDVRCCNCHRRRTALVGKSWRTRQSLPQ